MLDAWEFSQSNEAYPDERSESSRTRPVSQVSNFSHSDTVTHEGHIITLSYVASPPLYKNNTESSTRLPTISTSKRPASCSPVWRSQCRRSKCKSVKCLKGTGGTMAYSGSRSTNDIAQGKYEKGMGRITDVPVTIGLKRPASFFPAKGLTKTKSEYTDIATPKSGCQTEMTRTTGCSSIHKLRHADPELGNSRPMPDLGHKNRMRKNGKQKNDMSRINQVIKIPAHGKNDLTMPRSESVQSSSPGCLFLDSAVEPRATYPFKHNGPKDELTTSSRRMHEMKSIPMYVMETRMPVDPGESRKQEPKIIPRSFDADVKSECYLPVNLKFVGEMNLNSAEWSDLENAEIGKMHPPDHNTEESTSIPILPTSERSTSDPVFYVLPDITFDESLHISSKMKVQLKDASKKNMDITEQTSQVPSILSPEIVSDSSVCHCLLADNSTDNLSKVLLSELSMQSKECTGKKIEQGFERTTFENQNTRIPIHPSSNESEQNPTSWYDWRDLSSLTTQKSIRSEPKPHFGYKTARSICAVVVESLVPQVMSTGPLQLEKNDSGAGENRGDQDKKKSFHDCSPKQFLTAIKKYPIPITLSSIEGPSDTEWKPSSFKTKKEMNIEVLRRVHLASHPHVRDICSNAKTIEAAQRIRPDCSRTKPPQTNLETNRRLEAKEELDRPADIIWTFDQNGVFSTEEQSVLENVQGRLSVGAQEKLVHHNEPKSDAGGVRLKVDAETQTPCPEKSATNCLEDHIRMRAKMRVRKRKCNRQKGDGRRTYTESTDDRRKQGSHISPATTKGDTTRTKGMKANDLYQEDRQSIFEEEPEQEILNSNVSLNRAQQGSLRQKVYEKRLQKASVTLWGAENVSNYTRKPSEQTDPAVVTSQPSLGVTEAELVDKSLWQLHCLEMGSPTAPEWDQSDLQAESSTADTRGWETPMDFHEAFIFDKERCLMGCKPIDSPAISKARTEVSTQTITIMDALMLKTTVNQSESEVSEPSTSSDFKWEEVTRSISVTGRVGSVSPSITLFRKSSISQFKQACREAADVSGCHVEVKSKSISNSKQEETKVDLSETLGMLATELVPAVEWDQPDAYTKSSLADSNGWGSPTGFQKSFRLYNEHLSDTFTTSKTGATSWTRILPSLSTPMLNTNTILSETETKRLTSFVGIERKDCTQRIFTARGGIMSGTSTTLYDTPLVSQSRRNNEENTRVMGPHLAVELRSMLDLEHVVPGIDLPEAIEFPETEWLAESEPDQSEVYVENSTTVSSQWSPRINFHKSFDLYAESVSVNNKPVDTVTMLRIQESPSISSPLLKTIPIQLEHETSKPATSAIMEGTEQMLTNRRKSSVERSVTLLSTSPILQSTRGNKETTDISDFHLAVESESMLCLEHVEPGVDPPEAVRLLETELLAGSERDKSYMHNENSRSSDGFDIEEESSTISLSGSDDIACFSSLEHAEMVSPSQPNVKSSRLSSQMGDFHRKAPSFTSISTAARDPVTFVSCLPHSLRSSTRVEQQFKMINTCTVDSVHWNCMGARAQSSIPLSTASSTFSPPRDRKSTFFVSPETNSSHFPSSTSRSCPCSIVGARKLRAYPTAFLALVAPCPIYYQIPLVVAVPRFFIYSSTSPQALVADARNATQIVSTSHKNVNEHYDDTCCSPAACVSASVSDTKVRNSSSLLEENPVPSSKTPSVPKQVGLEKGSSTYRPQSLYTETSPGLSYDQPQFLSSAVGKPFVSKRTSMDDLYARLSKTPTHYSPRDLEVLTTATPMHSIQLRTDQDVNTFLIRHPVRVSQNTPVQTNEERESSMIFTPLDSVPPSYSAPYYYAYESYSSTTDDIPSLKTYFAPIDGINEGCVSPVIFEHGVEESISTFVCPWSKDMPHSIRASLTYTQRVHDLVTELDSALHKLQLCESKSIRKTSALELFSNSPERLAPDLQKSAKDIIVVSSYTSEQPIQISGSVEYDWPLKETAFSLREYQHLGSTRPSVFSSFRLPLLPLPASSSLSCTPDRYPDQNAWITEPLAAQLEVTPTRPSRSSLAVGPPSNRPHATESKSTADSWDSRRQSSSLRELRKAQLSKNLGHNLPYRTSSSVSLSTKPSVSDYSEHREESDESSVHPFKKKDFPLSGDRRSSCSVRRRTTHDLDARKNLQRCQCCRLRCKRCTRKPNRCECVLQRSCHCTSRGVRRRRSHLDCLTESCPHPRSRCILGAFKPNFGCLSLERTRIISVSRSTRNTAFICSAPCLDQDFGFHAMQTQETVPVYVRCQTDNKVVCTHGCGRTNIPRHHMCYFGK